MSTLVIAVIAFVGQHFLLSARPVRHRLVAVLGEMAFLGLYSAVALALLVWVINAYQAAPWIDVWYPPTAAKHLSLTLMPLACVLVVAGFTTPSPAAVSTDPQGLAERGATGIQTVTRHPVMWGIALWGILHMLANGDAASLVLFSGMTVLALGGAVHIDAKRRRLLGRRWESFAKSTSFLPLAAVIGGRARVSLGEIGWWRIVLGVVLYAALLWAHPWLFGVSPFAL